MNRIVGVEIVYVDFTLENNVGGVGCSFLLWTQLIYLADGFLVRSYFFTAVPPFCLSVLDNTVTK